MTVKIKSKVLIPHRRNCSAVAMVRAKDWDHPWGVHIGHVWLTENGVKSKKSIDNTTIWLKFGCNDTLCKAELIVNQDDILVAVNKKKHKILCKHVWENWICRICGIRWDQLTAQERHAENLRLRAND